MLEDDYKKIVSQRIQEWRNNPLGFVTDTINFKPDENPTQDQIDVLNSLVQHRFVAVKSGHGIGKTALESWIILWFLTCYTNCRVPCTAPTGDQLVRVLWPEIYKWIQRSKLKDFYEWEKSKVWIKGEEATSFALYRTARTQEALSGFHEENLLYVLEEASGIEDAIWEPVEGALTTSNSRAIALGNPTRPEGNFYRAFTDQSKFWKSFTFNSENSPLVTKEYIQRSEAKYGRDSDIFRIRVLGEFPRQASDVWIPLYLCERSLGNIVKEGERRRMGVDVARFGNNYTVWVIRTGGRIVYSERHQTMDLMEIAAKTQVLMREQNVPPENVFIDEVGVGGGVVDRLHEQNVGVVGVNTGIESLEPETFKNKRAELWFTIKHELIENKLNLKVENNDDMTKDLCGELASPKYKYVLKGLLQLESKEDMTKRGIQSPDIADALALTYYFREGGTDKIISAPHIEYPKNY